MLYNKFVSPKGVSPGKNPLPARHVGCRAAAVYMEKVFGQSCPRMTSIPPIYILGPTTSSATSTTTTTTTTTTPTTPAAAAAAAAAASTTTTILAFPCLLLCSRWGNLEAINSFSVDWNRAAVYLPQCHRPRQEIRQAMKEEDIGE